MINHFPVFIGITGKRRLSEGSASDETAERKVRKALAAVFDHLEKLLPGAPKVLLTGAAAGADLFAAQEILRLIGKQRRKNWLVLAVLPFELALFEQDFAPDEWSVFKEVLGDARTRSWVLPRLRITDGKLAQSRDLERRVNATGDQKDARRRHYEQVGLWIAETANVLLAVMPADDTTKRIGGTARIVASRRVGRPDPIAAEVIAASEILAPRPELRRPQKGYVWLIDPIAEPLSEEIPVTVLPPMQEGTSWWHAYKAPGIFEQQHRKRTSTPPGALGQRIILRESQTLLEMIRQYAEDSQVSGQLIRAKDAKELSSWPTENDPAQVLTEISSALRDPTNFAANRSRIAFYWLAGLFLLTVLTFEVFAKFLSTPKTLSVYVGLLIAIMVMYFVALTGQWQPIAEDRRAVREAIRVQCAWWRAGVADRVDHLYLQGADLDLSRVREAARNVITWALLTCLGNLAAVQWKQVFAPEQWPKIGSDTTARFPNDWVGNQYYYFRQREAQREAKGQLVAMLSWALFATGAWLALLLLAALTLDPVQGILRKLSHATEEFGPYIAGFVGIACVGAICACWWTAARLHHIHSERRRVPLSIFLAFPAALLLLIAVHLIATIVDNENALRMIAIFLALSATYSMYWLWIVLPDTNGARLGAGILGLGAAVLFGFALQVGAAIVGHHDAEHAATYMTIVFVIFLPALGGAMRFLSEKLAIEAEALSYREAHHAFEHAVELLCAIGPGTGDASKDGRAQDIIKRLGMLALDENESWLKSRRQRPLSPVIGG